MSSMLLSNKELPAVILIGLHPYFIDIFKRKLAGVIATSDVALLCIPTQNQPPLSEGFQHKVPTPA